VGEDPLENMQARAAQCRRLADLTHDREMTSQLLEWAAAIDADIARLQARLGKSATDDA